MSVARQLWVTGEAPPWKPKLGPRQRQQGPPAGEKPKGSRKLELFPHLFSQVFLSSHRAPPSQYLGGLWSRQLHARHCQTGRSARHSGRPRLEAVLGAAINSLAARPLS